MDQDSHNLYMQRAAEISRQKMLAGEGGPFGAVVVRDDNIIGEGWNQVTSTADPTAGSPYCDNLGMGGRARGRRHLIPSLTDGAIGTDNNGPDWAAVSSKHFVPW